MIDEVGLEANGLHFRALAAGPAGGAPVLLLHGFPEGAESWTAQLEALAGEGFRALAPDLRGYGGTDAPPQESDYAIEPLVADVLGLIDGLGWERVHLAGHDWGSLVGWPFVSQHADRVLTWTSLSVGHPLSLAETARDPEQRQKSAYIGLFREPGGKAEKILAEDGWRRLRGMYRLGPNPNAIPDEVIERYVEGFARPGRMTAALNYYRAAMFGPVAQTGPIATPSALIWGEEDPALGRLGAEGTERYMTGPYWFRALAGAGHWLQFERPDEVSRLLLDRIRAA